MITRDSIVEAARGWIDTPFSHQGRVKGQSVDCLGLVYGVAIELGIESRIPSNYVEDPRGRQLLDGCDEHLIAPENPQTMAWGRIGIFWGWSRNEPQHLCIFGHHHGRLTMIHAFSKREKVVEHSVDDFWKKRFVTCYEYPGTEPLFCN